ncbi:MAG TPA: chromate resistance protein ChrB domain-containing protein [Thermodesulfobacteriota bacterium]
MPPNTARWLLLIASLPPTPSRHRVRVWRMLRKWGALGLRKSVYVLPYSKDHYESFQWIAQEIQSVGGEATFLKVAKVENLPDEALIRLFRDARREDYGALAAEVREALDDLDKTPPARPGARVEPANARLAELTARFEAIAEIDFFDAPGRAAVVRALDRLRRRLVALGVAGGGEEATALRLNRTDYQGQTWVTRERPFVDRLASAWLIRRFIDPAARFGFIGSDEQPPAGAIPFDVHGAALGHRGEDCTFETLVKAFGLEADVRLRYLAELVHEADLKDEKFAHAETRGLVFVLTALRRTIADDHQLLEEGMTLFERLYESLEDARPTARGE